MFKKFNPKNYQALHHLWKMWNWLERENIRKFKRFLIRIGIAVKEAVPKLAEVTLEPDVIPP